MATPIIPTTTTTPTTATTAAKNAGSSTLGKDDFLKLLVSQLKYQDPLAPSDNKDFLAQMAQFSTLEQTSNMADANVKVAQSLQTSSAVSLIGRTVTVSDDSGTSEGIVERVAVVDGKPSLTVGGRAGVDPARVVEVR